MKHIRLSTFLLAGCLSASLITLPAQAKKGGGKPGGGGGGSDSTPPAQITDLVAFNDVNSGHFLTLQWTTVGDDGNSGTASAYEVRYSTAPVSNFPDVDAWWNQAETYFLPPRSPQDTSLATGDTQYSTVRFLNPNQAYHVAMKVEDEVGNSSPVSNVATTSTAGADWIIEEVASTGGVLDLDLEFDPLDGLPSVVYSDQALQSQLFLHQTPAGWLQTSVGDFGNPRDINLEFELSSLRLPVVGHSSNSDGLLYSIWNPVSEVWELESVDSGYTRTAFGFAVDSLDNQPSFSYFVTLGKRRNSYLALVLVHRTSQGWEAEIVDNSIRLSPGNQYETRLAYGPDGTAWIAYADELSSGQKVLQTASRSGGAGNPWNTQNVVAVDNLVNHIALECNPLSGEPMLSFVSFEDNSDLINLHVASMNQSSWIVDTLDAELRPGNVSRPSIAFSELGDVSISYHRRESFSLSPAIYTIAVASSSQGGPWSTSAIDRGEVVNPSTAIQPGSNSPFVLYDDPGVFRDGISTLYLARPVTP